MKRLGIVMLMMIFVTGCATTEQRAKTEGAGGGALLGALAGAAVGILSGGDAKSALKGAGVGAVVGGVGGYVYANSIAKRRAELEGKENDLDARITFARGINQETQQYNEQLEQQVNDLLVKTETHKMTQQELLQEKQALTNKIEEANHSLAMGKKELLDLKNFRSQQEQSEALDAEIAILEDNLAQLKRNTTSLAALNQRI